MGLSEAQGYDALFIKCCRHTKQAHIIPTSTTTSARGLATLFRDHIWKLHGLPETALSDRGLEWITCTKFAYNNKIHTATYVSPFYTNYGMNPRMGIELWRAEKLEPAKEFAE